MEQQQPQSVPFKICDNADELIRASSDLLAQHHESPLLWRGVGDAVRHTLVPSALRPSIRESLLQFLIWKRADRTTPERIERQWLIDAETTAIKIFYQAADNQGIWLPPTAIELHSQLVRSDSTFRAWCDDWPPSNLLPLMALAQHHGVPTRLLDWSSDRLIALYFAGRHGLKRILDAASDGSSTFDISNEWIGLWQANASILESLSARSTEPRRIHIVDVPRHGNQNLAAQRGRFTVLKPNLKELSTLVDLPLDHAFSKISELNGETFSKESYDHCFSQLRMPLHQTPDLLKMLRIEFGYDAARVFPGLAGCGGIVEEQAWIERAKHLISLRSRR